MPAPWKAGDAAERSRLVTARDDGTVVLKGTAVCWTMDLG